MERNKKTQLPFLLLALLSVGAAQQCPSNPDINLSCDSDFNSSIICVWNSTSVSEQPDNVCTLNATRRSKYTNYNSSCKLEQVDVSRPTLRKCSLIFNRKYMFSTNHDLSMSLSCNPGKQTLNVIYRPACHIKLNPPPQPRINFTTASWKIPKHNLITEYSCQLQWKHQNHLWRDPSGQENQIYTKLCISGCTEELDDDQLIQGDRYEARLRVKAIGQSIKSTWSDWGPTASWESPIGRIKQPSSGFAGGSVVIIAVAAAFAVFLVVSFFKTNKTTWVYMVKRIKPKPIPDPKNSFLQDGNFQNWLSPHFASESFLSPFKLVEIVSVEVASSVDAVSPCGPEAALLEKMRSESSHQSTSSNFSNPSYSQLCSPPPPPPPPVSSLTAGNLAPCNSDTPYGPVGGQAEDKNAEQDEDVKEEEIRQLLSKSSNSSELMLVISDYEKVEKLPVVCVRLQSLDSGVSSGEEVSQESLEADSINVTDEGEEERAAGEDIHKLFGGSGGSIQVCTGYERVQKLQTDSPELLSQDSGIGGVGEEQGSQEESPEDAEKSESSSLLFTPLPPSSASPCFLPCFTTQPLKFSEPHVSPALHPLPSHLLERIALMSTNRSVEPSGDGYMPVRQDQS